MTTTTATLTPTPWFAIAEADGRILIQSEATTVAMVPTYGSARDAQVLAAAPDLLEALQDLMSIDGHSALTREQADAIHAKALAAIAKAEGRV